MNIVPNYNYSKEIGKRISQQRTRLGYTQKDVIEKISKITKKDKSIISEKQLSRIENGTSGTTLENYSLIFRVLHKTPNYFMLGVSDDTVEEADLLIKEIDKCLKDCDIQFLKCILISAKAFADQSKGL